MEIFSIKPQKKINLALLGVGAVGSVLIDQILDNRDEIRERKGLYLNIIAVANSRRLAFCPQGLGRDWRQKLEETSHPSDTDILAELCRDHQLTNLIAVDNSASNELVTRYESLVQAGFDLVSSNKIFNTLDIATYRSLRKNLAYHQRKYLYETNVGAGLPLIDTIRLLHESGEDITRIKGVFSGSLSYMFNQFSQRKEPFSNVLKEAMTRGYTEPDPREDLSGNDVARKLLILARELDLENEFSDIRIQNLIPPAMRGGNVQDFLSNLDLLDAQMQEYKNALQPGEVLRYTGDLKGDLSLTHGELDVQLVSVPAFSPLGQLQGSDSIFEIYTHSYGERPIVIMGAGAGAQVTARGVLGDILRMADSRHSS